MGRRGTGARPPPQTAQRQPSPTLVDPADDAPVAQLVVSRRPRWRIALQARDHRARAVQMLLDRRRPVHRGSSKRRRRAQSRHSIVASTSQTAGIELAPEDCPTEGRAHGRRITANPRGRWPANLLLSHGRSCTGSRCEDDCPVSMLGERHRFFYAPKAPRRERDAGCEQLPRRIVQTYKIGARNVQLCEKNPVANVHPTVKPIDLMRWLVRLLNPPGGLVLDPFAGSGSTGAAALLEGARFLGIEREAAYIPIARARITHWGRQGPRSRATRRKSPAESDLSFQPDRGRRVRIE